VSQKKSPFEVFWHFSPNGWEFLAQILPACYPFLSTLDYKFLFNYMQPWWSYAILSPTTIMCSKCPPSTETCAGWSHLILHNFVTVGHNWIKMCILTCMWTFNRRTKFGLKIPNCLGKCQTMPPCVLADGGHFAHMMWTGWSCLIWHNFVKVAVNWIKICNLA